MTTDLGRGTKTTVGATAAWTSVLWKSTKSQKSIIIMQAGLQQNIIVIRFDYTTSFSINRFVYMMSNNCDQ